MAKITKRIAFARIVNSIIPAPLFFGDGDGVDDDGVVGTVVVAAGGVGDFVDDVLAGGDVAEDGVVVGGEGVVGVHDEELAAVGVGAGVGHAEGSFSVGFGGVAVFVFELVAGPAHSGAGGVTALDHEAGDDAVEDDAVVEAVAGEDDEAVDGFGSIGGEEVAGDFAGGGVDDDGVMLGDVDLHLGDFGVGFALSGSRGRGGLRGGGGG